MPERDANDGRTLRQLLRSPHGWVTTTYFAEGFPYTLVNSVADVLFLAMGANVKAIGLTALLHLPWNLKFLWSPALDRYETKRRFLLGCEVVMLALVLVLAVLGTGSTLAMLTLVFLLLALVSATHDVAIDGYYMEALDERAQATFVGYRAAAYRGSMIAAGGLMLMLEGWLGWRVAWLCAAAVLSLLLVYHATCLPHAERRQAPLGTWWSPARRRATIIIVAVLTAVLVGELRWPWLRPLRDRIAASIAGVPFFGTLALESWIALVFLAVVIVSIAMLGRMRRWLAGRDTEYARGFAVLLAQPGIDRALTFIVLFRLGESFLMKMRIPFLKHECGMSDATFGLVNGTIGTGVTLTAGILGGVLIARYGLRRCMWPLVLAQNLPNLLYAWLAASDPQAVGLPWVSLVVWLEDFGAGLGTPFFMVYLMRCVDPRHKATHMAVLTAIMSLGFTLAGVASGFVADAVGFPSFFVLTFVATLPSMAMIPWIPYLDRSRAQEIAGDPDAFPTDGSPPAPTPTGAAGGESAEKTTRA